MIQIGGKYNSFKNRVERPFEGVLAGLVFNNIRPLDLAAAGSENVKINGEVIQLSTIPFDYRQRYPERFREDRRSRMQKTNPSLSLNEPGINDDLIVGRKRCTGNEELYYDSR